MSLPDGYTDLAAGKVANVQTALEMFEKPPLRADTCDLPLVLVRHDPVDLAWYRALFRRVGEPHLWFSRLAMSDVELAHVVCDARVEVYAVQGAYLLAAHRVQLKHMPNLNNRLQLLSLIFTFHRCLLPIAESLWLRVRS